MPRGSGVQRYAYARVANSLIIYPKAVAPSAPSLHATGHWLQREGERGGRHCAISVMASLPGCLLWTWALGRAGPAWPVANQGFSRGGSSSTHPLSALWQPSSFRPHSLATGGYALLSSTCRSSSPGWPGGRQAQQQQWIVVQVCPSQTCAVGKRAPKNEHAQVPPSPHHPKHWVLKLPEQGSTTRGLPRCFPQQPLCLGCRRCCCCFCFHPAWVLQCLAGSPSHHRGGAGGDGEEKSEARRALLLAGGCPTS